MPGMYVVKPYMIVTTFVFGRRVQRSVQGCAALPSRMPTTKSVLGLCGDHHVC